MHIRTYALVDANNFYASCERVFNPKLLGKPVLVLSNNDGIVVARSNEVKDLGIPMGKTVFKIRHLIAKHNIHVFSSNYTLYADMSQRIMNILATFTPDIEIYSIDEAFLRLDRLAERDSLRLDRLAERDYLSLGHRMRKQVMQWTGIPVSVGIAQTKTLAKLANTIAKREKPLNTIAKREKPLNGVAKREITMNTIAKRETPLNGVCDFTRLSRTEREHFMKSTPVEKIWGVGRQYSKKLNMMGVNTVHDFVQLDPKLVRKHMTVVGYRTWLELNGTSCIELEDHTPDKKQIISSRSFGTPITELAPLKEALASYAARAAEKLRSQDGLASIMHVYITTNYFSNSPQYWKTAAARIHPATAYTPRLIQTAEELLEHIYRDGYRYKKAGIVLSGISPATSAQYDLFVRSSPREPNIMKAVDHINHVWGMGTVRTVAEGLKKDWSMQRSQLSKRFTTVWEEVLEV